MSLHRVLYQLHVSEMTLKPLDTGRKAFILVFYTPWTSRDILLLHALNDKGNGV